MSTIKRDHRFTVTPEHLTLDPRISDRAYRLWGRLDRYAGEDGNAMPSNETLAIELDTSPSSIDRAKRELVNAGWLKVVPNPGASSNYVLLNAPTAATMKLVEQARKERKLATVDRREKAAERRRVKKRQQRTGAKAQDAASAQVSDGGHVTSDATPSEEGHVTSDVTGHVTSGARGHVTGDEDKEASFKEASVEGDSDPSLRSGSARSTDAEVLPIEGVKALTGTVLEESPKQQAYRIVRDYLVWFESQTGSPILDRTRTVEALRKNYVEKALEIATETQIRTALANSHSELPSQIVWRRVLREAMGGRNLAVVSQYDRQEPGAYSDNEWAEKIAQDAAAPEESEAEAKARVQAMFAARAAGRQ